jgi:hypothetical protein
VRMMDTERVVCATKPKRLAEAADSRCKSPLGPLDAPPESSQNEDIREDRWN